MPADAPADSCPYCGSRMLPVLERSLEPAASGPLGHDCPVRLQCPSCGDERGTGHG